VSEFGRSILRDDGGLDRRGLGRVVFGDSEKLERLNAITHPPLVRGIMERLEDLARGDPAGVVVRASEDIRVARLVDAGLSESEARARIGAQLPDAAYESRADEIIDNDGSLEELRASVRALWERIDGARRRP
jgi:dephospho-CoA kinase